MSHGFVNADRQMIARWRESTQSAGAPDLLSLRAHSPSTSWNGDIDSKQAEFNDNPSIGIAAELANAAILEQRKDILELVAGVILAPHSKAPRLLQKQVQTHLNTDFGSDPTKRNEIRRREEVARLRGLLSIEPRNPALLMDLARLHATDGHREKAERIAHQALHLAPNNRWILRSSSRLLIAHENFEDGHKLLARARATPHDPWLISAELAAAQAAGRTPIYWRQAQAFLNARALPMIHLSELASAVATIDLHEGKIKKAKERFQLSLLDPTENALAQLKWAESKIRNGFQIDELITRNDQAFEAAFRRAYMLRDMERALQLAQAWVADEPFAPEPVANVTYIASLLDDYVTAIRSTERELRLAGARHLPVINNRVYALISSGNAFNDPSASKEIEEWINSVTRQAREGLLDDISEQVHTVANLGLLAYRSGAIEDGRQLYDQATLLTKNPKAHQAAGTVLCYHAREAILSNAPWKEEILEQVRNAMVGVTMPGTLFYFDKVNALAKAPNKAAEILSRESAEQFKVQVKKAAPNFRVEKADNGRLILWVPKKNG